MRKFIQPVSMKVPSIGDINPLLDELKVLGYTGFPSDDFVSHPYLVNNFLGDIGFIDNVVAEARCDDGRFEITSFNPDLFLALAACSEGEEFWPGECVTPRDHQKEEYEQQYQFIKVLKVTIRHFYPDGSGSMLWSENFRKATAEEIIKHFSKEVDKKPKAVEKLRDENGDMVRWVPKVGEEIWVWDKGQDNKKKSHFRFFTECNRVGASYESITKDSSYVTVQIWDNFSKIDEPFIISMNEFRQVFSNKYGVPAELIQIDR